MIRKTGRCFPERSRCVQADPAIYILPSQLADTFHSQANNGSIPQVVNEYFEGQDTVHNSLKSKEVE